MLREAKDLFYSFYGNNYLRYSFGQTNVVITAPHGGGIRPYNIPKRRWGKLLKDSYTRRLTEKVVELMYSKPYYVISDIHRNRVDLNRDLYEAAQGNYKAERIWKMWNGLLENYIGDARDIFGKILYIDIHSHNDSDKFQLGYNISSKDYLDLYYGKKIYNITSLDSLDRDVYDMIFGECSFKESFELMGYEVFMPDGEEPYFNGGRNIEIFNGDGVGAVQIEVPVSILEKDINKVAVAVKFAIESFKQKYT